ncbi:50S ribosomal protein L35 [bacterium]|nr:50S ribosomal protein L35 [bacterium]
MKSKTRKSLLKRFKITKTGKILRRIPGQNHFRAKKPRSVIREKRKWVEVSKEEAQIIKKYLCFPPKK